MLLLSAFLLSVLYEHLITVLVIKPEIKVR